MFQTKDHSGNLKIIMDLSTEYRMVSLSPSGLPFRNQKRLVVEDRERSVSARVQSIYGSWASYGGQS